MCNSLTNLGCDADPKAHNIEPVECTYNNMIEWQQSLLQHNILKLIFPFFEIDNSQHYQATAPMACAKTTLNGK